MASSNPPPRRVMLWAVPRSLSTVFQKCMSFVDGVQIINEPYAVATQFGPEGKQIQDEGIKQLMVESDTEIEAQTEEFNAPLAFDEAICTLDWVKKTLEADYPGKKLIFCKDMAPEGNYHALPKGFKHTFLIRDPIKVFISFRKMILAFNLLPEDQQKNFRLTDLPQEALPAKYLFGEMVDLLHYLQENKMESNPVVIDADDLQSHPESILRQYCEAVGIPYSNDLLQWEAGDDITNTWIAAKKIMRMNKIQRGGFYARALSSVKFEPSSTPIPDKNELTPDVVQFAEEADKYYKELYEMRLKP
ncbi:uncharacterized protein [Amphiura filiformis]|uniref:uncharacterized protein n=1 Tax=Amphiura filiformis TaxID=82378 RepID=UPI003B21C568